MGIDKQALSTRVRHHLEAYIRQQITNGNTRLPSEREMCRIFSTSRITLQKVLTEMETEGYIARYQGKGTFINSTAYSLKINLAHPRDLRELIEKSGYAYSSKLMNYQLRKPNEEERELFQLLPDEFVVDIKKVFKANGIPVILCNDILPKKILTHEFPHEELADSIFTLYKKYSSKEIVWDSLEIDAVCISDSDDEIVNAFEGYDSALLSFKVIKYSLDNSPILLGKNYVNPKKLNFHLIRHHK